MDDLLAIGRFSRMSRLSIRALRLYDEQGLLAPSWVDPASGYRYYRASQARAAEAIRVLRMVDMPWIRSASCWPRMTPSSPPNGWRCTGNG